MSQASVRSVVRMSPLWDEWCGMVGRDHEPPGEEGMGDLFCDFMHLADACDLNLDDILARAAYHFEAERGEGDDLANAYD